MRILDQLREEAEQKKHSEQQEMDQKQEKKYVYSSHILPKMQKIFIYLQELVQHLNYLEIPVQVENYSSRFPKLGTLTQNNYKINTDGFGGFSDIEKLMHINVTFYVVGKGGFEYTVYGKSAIEKEIAFLHASRLSSETKKMPGIRNEEAAIFFIKRLIPVRLRFEVDYENSLIKVVINNHTDFSTYVESWRAEQIDSEFLDTVARYLLRKDLSFVKPEISDEHREVLRKRMAKIKARDGTAKW